MNASTALFVAVSAPVFSQVESLRPPNSPDRPFRVFVFAEPRGESKAVARVRQAEEECHKILKRKRDWFVIVKDREEAEIVMELKAYWMDEQMTMDSSPMSGTPINVTREHHYLFAEVTILGAEIGLRADDRRSLKGAASKLMDALQEFCRKNYGQILRHRDPPSDRGVPVT